LGKKHQYHRVVDECVNHSYFGVSGLAVSLILQHITMMGHIRQDDVKHVEHPHLVDWLVTSCSTKGSKQTQSLHNEKEIDQKTEPTKKTDKKDGPK
jgi:hypothetical protein